MNFTREPLIETVITSKDGYKLALRNSKGGCQEEFFVDALEVISFGNSCFYRSLEKPKSFLIPVSDYEILEVRETRMILKSACVEHGIKIAGGREKATRSSREERVEESPIDEVESAVVEEQKIEKRRERRRTRKRRTKADQPDDDEVIDQEGRQVEKPTLIPPPSTLISDTINRYKEIAIHETSGEPKEGEFSEEPLESSCGDDLEAQPQKSVENDKEIPF